jgi:hypothetical protein
MSLQYDGDFRDTHNRIYGHATSSHGARRAFLAAMLAVSVFFLVLSLSARQATQPGTAQRVIESGIASLTDIDRLIAEDADALRRLAQSGDTATFAIPGYPLDIRLTHDEIRTLSNDQLRDLILSRSSAVVYTEGLRSFDRTGSQSISRFSSQGVLKSLVGELSESTNHRATIATVVFAVLVALFAVAVLAAGEGWSRLRTAGIATLLGALPGLALFAFAWFMAGRIGGGDPFVQDIRSIARSVLSVPMRNFLVVTVLGGFIVVLGAVFGMLSGRLDDGFIEDHDYEPQFDEQGEELEA